MFKVNITNHSDNELCLMVMNDEDYYSMLDEPKKLLDLIHQEYTYTDKQLILLQRITI